MKDITLSRSLNNKLTEVQIGTTRIWFSYETPVAFSLDYNTPVVSQNIWSQTTNRHLNSIDGGSKSAKSARLPHELFENLLNELTITATQPFAVMLPVNADLLPS